MKKGINVYLNRFEMKKKVIIFISLLILSSCRNVDYEYYDSGAIKSKISKDSKGDFDKEAIFYYENGDIEKKVLYQHGYIMECIVYHKNGKVNWESPYKNNKKDGLYNEYYEDGTIHKKILFKEGEVIHYREFDTLTKLTAEYTKLDIDSIPDYKKSFIKSIGEIRTDSFSLINFVIPNIPPFQITPLIINGNIRVKDKINGVWEIKANNTDSLKIGIRLTVNDTMKIDYGWASFPVIK